MKSSDTLIIRNSLVERLWELDEKLRDPRLPQSEFDRIASIRDRASDDVREAGAETWPFCQYEDNSWIARGLRRNTISA